MKIIHYLTILRPVNAAMAAGAVWLGAWISSSPLPAGPIFLLATVAFLSTGFGNVVNDLLDRHTDRISHPDRPLPSGTVSVRNAFGYLVFLGIAALLIAFLVAPRYGYATMLPLAALVLYALFLKGTPLAGNLLVSLLVAYALVFGSLGAPGLRRLVLPALLAMLLNLSREIIKDIEDAPGDTAAGITTSAALPPELLKKFLLISSILYGMTVFLPYFLGHFGFPYVIVISLAVLPLHIVRLRLLLKASWTAYCSTMSLLLKIEMLLGLVALAVDHLTATV